MPRFTVKDLLIATSLIATGIGLLTILFSGTDLGSSYGWLPFWLGGGTLIGAGIGVPFRRIRLGATAALVFQILITPLLFLLLMSAS